MTTSNRGLKFGSFEDLDPEDNKRILSFLKSGSEPPSLKLYWETPVNKCNSTLVKSTPLATPTVISDAKPVKLVSGVQDSDVEGPSPKSVQPAAAPAVLFASPSGNLPTPIDQVVHHVDLDEPVINSQPSISQDVERTIDDWANHSDSQRSEGWQSESQHSEKQPDGRHMENRMSESSHSQSPPSGHMSDSRHSEGSHPEGHHTMNCVAEGGYSENRRFEDHHFENLRSEGCHSDGCRPEGHHSEISRTEVHNSENGRHEGHHSESGRSETPHSESSRSESHHSESSRPEGRHFESGRSVGRHSESGRSEGHHSESGRSEGHHSESGRSEGRPSESGRSEGSHTESGRSDIHQLENVMSESHHSDNSRPEDRQSEGGMPEDHQSESIRPEDKQSEGSRPEDHQPESGRPEDHHSESGHSESGRFESCRSEGWHSENRQPVVPDVSHNTKPEGRDIEPKKLENSADVALQQPHQQQMQLQQMQHPHHQLMHQHHHQVMQHHQQPQHQPMQPQHQQPHHQPMQHPSMQHQHQSMQQQQPHHQPMQHQQPTHDQRVQAQTAAGLFKNYFPPPPPISDYVPAPVPVPTTVQRENLGPQGVRPQLHVDANYNMVPQQRWTEEQTRGHVDDTGVYHRPTGGPSPVAMPGPNALMGPAGKTYERRNKKKGRATYYERLNQTDPNHIQTLANMSAGYHQVPASVSVRQAMEVPTCGSYVNVPGSQPGAGVMSSQYTHQMQQQANYAAGLMQMTPGMMMMIMQQQQQQQQQRHQVTAQQQQQYLSQQELRMALTSPSYQPHYGHPPHLQHAQPNMYHGQPAVATPTGVHTLRAPAGNLGQNSPARSIPISPVGLAPSQPGLLGRSPPHASPIVPGYPEPRLLEQHHGYHAPPAHQPHPSPTVPAQLVMPQAPLPNSTNNFSGSLSSANSNSTAHKEALRTSGPPRGPVMVTALPLQPQISTFITPPQHHESKLPSPHTVTMSPVPPQPSHIASCVSANVMHTDAKPIPETSQVDKPEEGVLGTPADVNEIQKDEVLLDLSSNPQPGSPVIPTDKQEAFPCETPQTDDDEVVVSSSTGSTDNAGSAGSAEADPIAAVHVPETGAENDNEDTSGISASVAKSSFTLTFGTVQDIATMNAQPVSEVVINTNPDEVSSQVGPARAVAEEVEMTVGDSVIPPASVAPKPEPTSVTAAVATSPVAVAAPDVRPTVPSAIQSSPPPPATTTEAPSPLELPNVPNSAAVSVEEALKKHPTAVLSPISSNGAVAASPIPVAVVTKPAEPTPSPSPPKVVAPTPTPAPAPVPQPSAWGVPKMWSDLFNSEKVAPGGTSEPAAVPVPNHAAAAPNLGRKSDEKDDSKELKKPVATVDDSRAKSLGDILLGYTVKYSSVSLQPRGLYNRSNWCYINATLQALLACPALYQMMKALPLYKPGTRGSTSTPVMDCMVQFVNEYTVMAPQQLRYIEKSSGKGPVRTNTDVRHGQPFEPVNILKMLQVIQYNTSFKYGRQEDAEEFMSCILNALHDEMVACINTARPEAPAENKAKENGECGATERTACNTEEEDQWEQVGPKNKSVVTRSQAKLKQSPISDVFGGQMRSVFHAQGQKESATLQPFFCLQLDVQSEKVWTIEDALEGQAAKEIIHGYTDATTKQEVEAYRRLFIDDLPPVLIMHLKCFIYLQTGGAQKVIKNFAFKTDLTISKDLMSPNARSKFPLAKRNYELFAVVNHHGTRVIGGHYTADVFHSGLQSWIRLDDSSVHVVSAEKVVQFEPPRFPYLLYYRRKDLN